jgi:hypothetical protein
VAAPEAGAERAPGGEREEGLRELVGTDPGLDGAEGMQPVRDPGVDVGFQPADG